MSQKEADTLLYGTLGKLFNGAIMMIAGLIAFLGVKGEALEPPTIYMSLAFIIVIICGLYPLYIRKRDILRRL